MEASNSSPNLVRKSITIKGGSEECQLITQEVFRALRNVLAETCLILLQVSSTSPSSDSALSLNENSDPSVRSDLLNALKRLFPASPASRASLIGSSVALLYSPNSLHLGTWQGIYLFHWPSTESVELMATILPCQNHQIFSFSVDPPSRDCFSILSKISSIKQQQSKEGTRSNSLCVITTKHTSCSVASLPTKGIRLQRAISEIIPDDLSENGFFEHIYEGKDDMPAHCCCSIIGTSLICPFPTDNSDIVLCEHREGGGWGGSGRRNLEMTFIEGLTTTEVIPIQMGNKNWISIGHSQILSDIISGKQCKLVSVCVTTDYCSVIIGSAMKGDEITSELRNLQKHLSSKGTEKLMETKAIIGFHQTIPILQHGKIDLSPTLDLYLIALQPNIQKIDLSITLT